MIQIMMVENKGVYYKINEMYKNVEQKMDKEYMRKYQNEKE